MKNNLVTQDEMLGRARLGELVIRLFPLKFNNGYFVKGTAEKGSEVYATIREGEKDDLQGILNYQRGLKL